ncbi:hypothetical protein J2785_001550 [Burkholderia ambifaria]|nr:hypothetical protein [Burkholderia ambifaria]
MKAVVFLGSGDIRIDTVPDPDIADMADAVAREPGRMKVQLEP